MKLDTVDPQGGEERSAKIHRLREEIRSVLEREFALLGKYHEFASSFETVMPDEKLRHDAALQALSATLKLGRQEIVEAFNRQQEELALLEKAVGKLFVDIGAKTIVNKQDREELQVETPGGPGSYAPQQTASHRDCPMCGERITFDRKESRWQCYSCTYKELPGETAGADQPPGFSPAPLETEWRKKCPMCGGQMNYHAQDEQWFCYTCAHEELPADAGQGKSEEKRGQTSTPGQARVPSFAVPLSAMITDESRKSKMGTALSPSQLSARKKNCPVCHKKMDWHAHEKVWRCFFCNHKTRY